MCLVVGFGYGYIEQAFCSLYLRAYLWQVGDFERGAILFDYFHEGDVMEIQFVVLSAEFVLRKVECLVDQVVVFVFHCN